MVNMVIGRGAIKDNWCLPFTVSSFLSMLVRIIGLCRIHAALCVCIAMFPIPLTALICSFRAPCGPFQLCCPEAAVIKS
uniref:Uncharacterized protein n=1 Tax=Panagrellus redivivus TaxID=6233 RepID=A0A7E4ZQK7_PANRE